MRRIGLLETMARADLDALLAAVAADYRPGTLEAVAASDPAWRIALDETEREVGALYAALREADVTLTRWRQAVAELCGLWRHVNEAPSEAEGSSLEEVA